MDREKNRSFFDSAFFGPTVVYLCDWLPPDFGAVGQYSLLRAKALAHSGCSVTLYGLSSTSENVENLRCGEGRLKVTKLRSVPVPKGSLFKRLLWTLRTNVRLLGASFLELQKADTIVFTGAPPFLLHFLVPLNVILRRQLVYRITDFHPECLIAGLGRVPFSIRLIHRITIWLRRHIKHFEVLGEDQRERLQEIGIKPQCIVLVRDPSPVQFTGEEKPLPIPDPLKGRAVLLYSGNLGTAHDIDSFIQGYELHHRNGAGKVGFWLNAVGSRADEMSRALEERGLPFHHSMPVPLKDLASLMVSPHAHLITLSNPFVGYVVPSKIYACVESGRHLLYIGSEKSDIHKLGSGGLSPSMYHRVSVGDVAGVAEALDLIATQVLGSTGNKFEHEN